MLINSINVDKYKPTDLLTAGQKKLEEFISYLEKIGNITPDAAAKKRFDLKEMFNLNSGLPNVTNMLSGLEGINTLGDKAAKTMDNVRKAVEQFTDKLKSQTDAFANFVGLFDKYANKNVSSESLLSRLKNQVKTLNDFQFGINTLRDRGVSESLINELMKKGPSSTNEIMSLARSSDDVLTQYNEMYAQRQDIAGQLAYSSLSNETVLSGEQGNTYVNINITGNEIKDEYDIDQLVNDLVAALERRGVKLAT